MKRAAKILLITIAYIIGIEIILRGTGVFNTTSEQDGNGYSSNYGQVSHSWYIAHKANDTIIPPSKDFHYPYYTNKFGIRDKDYDTIKPDSVYRILFFGNSYVEGVGAPYDSTWPHLLEAELRQRHMHAEVINAGIAGSDVMYDYVFYRDKLKQYHPNLVIASLNNSEYYYHAFRGGMERFYADGTVHVLPVPWWDFLYHYSHIFRALYAVAQLPVKGAFFTNNNRAASPATRDIAHTLNLFSTAAHNNHAKFITILYPKAHDVKTNPWFFKNELAEFNTLQALLNNDSIPNINLMVPFRTKFINKPKSDYTYNDESHYNGKGYLGLAGMVGEIELFPKWK